MLNSKIFTNILILVSLLIYQRAYSQQVSPKLAPFFSPAIKGVFTQRCYIYSQKQERKQCPRFLFSKKGFFSQLDLHIDHKNSNSQYIVFKKDFLYLITQQRTYQYLVFLEVSLNKVYDLRNYRFNLWELTLDFFDQDKSLALKNIAVLFQDTHSLLHLNYLNKEDHAPYSQTINKLVELLELLSFKSLMDNPVYAKEGRIQLYPENIKSNPSIYHFYTSAYLHHKISKDQLVFRNQSRGFSFYLSVFYKTAYYYLGSKILYKDLAYIAPEDSSSLFRIKDLYLNYQAVYWSEQLTKKNKKGGYQDPPFDFELFQDYLQISLPNTVRSVFRQTRLQEK